MNVKLSKKAKTVILIAVLVLLAAVGIYYAVKKAKTEQSGQEPTDLETVEVIGADTTEAPAETDESTDPAAEHTEETPEETTEEAVYIEITEPETTAPPPQTTAAPPQTTAAPTEPAVTVQKNGAYSDKEHVALYIHTYGHLPPNFITKKDAEKAGWSGGMLDKVLPGMSIGGDYFGNYEGRLPKAKGRRWTECDVNTRGAKSRGEERIVFSNDGLIYYSPDHYESFELLYGQPS